METKHTPENMDKCYSTNGEDFTHNSVDEAVESLLDDTYLRTGETATLWEGDAMRRVASHYLTNVSEGMMDQAGEECGEYADGWEFSRSQSESLQEAVAKAVDEWATANNMQPYFYAVENVASFMVRFTDDDGGFEILDDAARATLNREEGA